MAPDLMIWLGDYSEATNLSFFSYCSLINTHEELLFIILWLSKVAPECLTYWNVLAVASSCIDSSDPCLVDRLLIMSFDCKAESFGSILLAVVVSSDLRVLDFDILFSE